MMEYYDDGRSVMGRDDSILNLYFNHEDKDKLSFRQPSQKNITELVPDSIHSVEKIPPALSTPSNHPDLHHQHFDFVTIAVGILVAVLIFIVLLVASCCTVRRTRRANKVRQSVYGHLAVFDIDDIDLLKAPTGGWHGTYQNNLAHGKERDYDDDVGTVDDLESCSSFSSSHSSVLLDSVYADSHDVVKSPGRKPNHSINQVTDNDNENDKRLFSSGKTIRSNTYELMERRGSGAYRSGRKTNKKKKNGKNSATAGCLSSGV